MNSNRYTIWGIAALMAYYPFSILYLAKIQLVILACTLLLALWRDVKPFGKLLQVLKSQKFLLLISLGFLFTTQDRSLIALIPILKPVVVIFIVVAAFSVSVNRRILELQFLLKITFSFFFVAVSYLMIAFGGLRPKSFEDMESIGSFSNVAVAPAIAAIVFSFYFFKYTRSKIYIVGILLACLMIALTQSRAGYGMAAISILFGAVLISQSKRGTNYLLIFWIVFSIISSVALASAVSPSLLETISSALDRFNLAEIFSELFGSNTVVDYVEETMREQQYGIAREIIQTNLFTGIGFNVFPKYFENIYGYSATVHNMFMKVWVAIGIGGLICLVLMFVEIMWNLRKKHIWYSSRGLTHISDFYLCLILITSLFAIQGQFRGMLGDYVFLLIIGIGLHAGMHKPEHEYSQFNRSDA